MPYNGSGTFTPPSSDFPAVTNTVISSTKFNNVINDIATGLTTALTKDGQTTPTANLTMGGYKLTNVGAATAVADAVRLDQVRKGVGMTLASVTGTDTITATGSPTIAALAAGMLLFLTPANTNTGAATLNPDGLGAKNLYYANAAMGGGEIRQNIPSLHYYDGTQFQLIGPFVGGTVPGNTTFSGTLTVAGAFAANGGVTLGNAAGDALTIASSAWTLSNAVTITGTWANLGTVTTADINGGTLDGVVIGGASAAAGTFTTVTASGLITTTGGSITAPTLGQKIHAGTPSTDTNVGSVAGRISGTTVVAGFEGDQGVALGRIKTTDTGATAVGWQFLVSTTPKGAIYSHNDGTLTIEAGGTTVAATYNASGMNGTLGATTPAAATVTTLTASTGAFTTLSATQTANANALSLTGNTSAFLVAYGWSADATYNAAATALFVGKNTGSSRSINAGGTVNASGADYAEYETKSATCGTVAKGQIVGFDADGKLTDVWADAKAFCIKSTDPSYVGGDVWGNEEALGLTQPKAPADDATEEELAQYEADKAAFDAALEAARQKVDRIAYSGKVPVNVTGAQPGDYIIAAQDGSGITGQVVTEPSFAEYRKAVGRVRRILADGRAEVAVLVH